MSPLEELFSVRRILVALDPTVSGTGLLDTAVEFAHRVEAELEGLFVEDVELMRLAEHPFAHEVSLTGGLPKPLDLAAIERDWRALATGVRLSLEARAREMNVRCSFRVVRGRLEAEVRAAAAEADLVIMDWAGAALTRHVRLKTSAELPVAGPSGSVLLLHGRPAPIESIVVVCDDGPATKRVLGAAARLRSRLRSEGTAPRLTVVCRGESRAAAADSENAARETLRDEGIDAVFRPLAGAGPEELADALRTPANALLMLPASLPLLSTDEGERLIADSEGPVLLVR